MEDVLKLGGVYGEGQHWKTLKVREFHSQLAAKTVTTPMATAAGDPT